MEAIYDYVAGYDPAAADRLVERIDRKLATLASNPRLGSPRPGGVADLRSFSVRPYLLLYQPVSDGIRLLRVLHGARDIGAALGAD